MHFKELFKAPGRNRGEGMLLIKTSTVRRKAAGSGPPYQGVRLQMCLFLLALKASSTETLSTGVGKIVKVRNLQVENTGFQGYRGFNLNF